MYRNLSTRNLNIKCFRNIFLRKITFFDFSNSWLSGFSALNQIFLPNNFPKNIPIRAELYVQSFTIITEALLFHMAFIKPGLNTSHIRLLSALRPEKFF